MDTKKLQNYFKDFLPLEYTEFKRGINDLSANPAVVAELLRVGCEESVANGGIKAVEMTFHRLLGKPEKAVVIKRTVSRIIYPDAAEKILTAPKTTLDDDLSPATASSNLVTVDEKDAPGYMLKKQFEEIEGKSREYIFDVKENPHGHTVAEVLVCNLYALAMAGGNLAAISLLFDYLDGTVADVIRLEGFDTVLIENFANVAPYEAIKGDDGVYYVEKEVVS